MGSAQVFRGRIVAHRQLDAAQALDLVAQARGLLEFEVAGRLLREAPAFRRLLVDLGSQR